jgi:hypothetical protein
MRKTLNRDSIELFLGIVGVWAILFFGVLSIPQIIPFPYNIQVAIGITVVTIVASLVYWAYGKWQGWRSIPRPVAVESMSERWPRLVRQGLRNDVLSHLENLMSAWKYYEGISPPERWVSLSHDSMQKQASEIADELLRLTSKHPDLWDAGIIGELNVISGELRQFAAVAHPETTEDAVAMDQHGKNAYRLTRELLSRIPSKSKWRAKLRL